MTASATSTKSVHPKPLKALIIGGGISGPAVSLFLQRAGITSIVYESHASPTTLGGGLGLGPNGLRVLDSLGLLDKFMKTAATTEGYTIKTHYGKRLGVFPAGSKAHNGYSSVIARRSDIHEALIDGMKEKGIPVIYNKKLVSINETYTGVRVKFEDGTEAEGDLVIGCDGIRSNVRKHVLGKTLEPNYSNLIGMGGFIPGAALPEVDPSKEDPMTMTRGPQGFIGYGYNHITEEWMWWCNFEATEEYALGHAKTMSDSELQQELLARYRNWHEPIPSLIAAKTDKIFRIPIYDLNTLPTWHSSRVVLIGDAAHPITPHAGQGASLALEDAMQLAKSLRDCPGIEEAFVEYQSLRYSRVDKIVAEARKRGEGKKDHGVIVTWIMEFTFNVFLLLVKEEWFDSLYGYKIEWEEKGNVSEK